MAILISDADIGAHILEDKLMKCTYQDLLSLKPSGAHSGRTVDLSADSGNKYRLIIRRSNLNPLDFSAILGYVQPNGVVFRLRRYNGKSHQHRNHIEKSPPFYEFHIHEATERYQQIGKDEDTYATPTTRYADLGSALHCVLADCNIQYPGAGQQTIFQVQP